MGLLGRLTSPDAAVGGWTLLVPFGSVEQHGPHLPLDTDLRIAVAVAEAAALRRPATLAAPGVPFGSAGEHAGFAGTLSIGQDALEFLIIELVRSLGPEFERVVLVNGHGGNVEALQRAVRRLEAEGRPTLLWSAGVPGGDAHAGRTETSLMLALAGDCVRLESAEAGATETLQQLLPALRRGGVQAVSPNGVLGDPAGASREEGVRIFDSLVESLLARLAKPA